VSSAVLARAPWNDPGTADRDGAAELTVRQTFDFIVQLRQLRAAEKLAPRAPLLVQGWPLAGVDSMLETMGGVTLATANGDDAAAEWHFLDAYPVAGTAVNVLAEGGPGDMRPRLEQELAKAESEAERARRKLADARFVERAPGQVVAAEREKAERFELEAAELRVRLADLGA
jgi:valyl-tRNA synthetase